MSMFRKICFWSAATAALLPFQFHIAPLAVAGIGAGLASLLGFLGGSNTNAHNLQIARETNQMNWNIAQLNNQKAIELMREQNKWNLDQWNRENEYNRPSMQVRRLLEAGINPAFSNQIGTGNSYVGLQSAPAPSLATPTMQAAVMQNPLANVASDLNQFASAWKAKADAAKAKNDIERENRQTAQEIKESEARIDKINADAKAVKDLTPEQVKEVQERIRNIKSQTLNTDQERRYKKAETAILKAQQDALEHMSDVQLMKMLEELRGIRNENNFELWRQNKIKSTGMDPVGQGALDALLRKAYREFIGGNPIRKIWKDIKGSMIHWSSEGTKLLDDMFE